MARADLARSLLSDAVALARAPAAASRRARAAETAASEVRSAAAADFATAAFARDVSRAVVAALALAAASVEIITLSSLARSKGLSSFVGGAGGVAGASAI